MSEYLKHPLMPNIENTDDDTYVHIRQSNKELWAPIHELVADIGRQIDRAKTHADKSNHDEVQACLQVIKRLARILEDIENDDLEEIGSYAINFVYDPQRADPEVLKMYLELMRIK